MAEEVYASTSAGSAGCFRFCSDPDGNFSRPQSRDSSPMFLLVIARQVARISRSRLAPKSIAPRLGLLLYWRAFTVTRRTLFAPIVWILFIS